MPATTVQLRLIPWARPLDERLGASFFRQVPHQPGVYRMLGEGGRLLYVGKASDLHQRLGSYRSLAHAARKTVRLLHAVRAITWEVCASEEAATLLENEWLRTYRPRFNRVGVWPQANGYLELTRCGEGLRLRFTRTPHGKPRADEERDWGGGWFTPVEPAGDRSVFGAFKPFARNACGALLRLLWGYREDWPEPVRLPRMLWSPQGHSAHVFYPVRPRTTELLRAFLTGHSGELLNVCAGFVEAPGSSFHQAFWLSDWGLAREFFLKGPARNRALRERFGVGSALIEAGELDDLLVRWRHTDSR